MTDDEQTVTAVASAIGDKLGERRRIHALLFRRRRQPFFRRPYGLRSVASPDTPPVTRNTLSLISMA